MADQAEQTEDRRQIVLPWEKVDWLNPGAGVYFKLFRIGEGESEEQAGMLVVEIPPHFEIPEHHHRVWHQEIILAGEAEVGGDVLRPGDMRIVPAGAVYGPVIAGPAGCRLVEIFERSGRADVDAVFTAAELSDDNWPFRI